MTNHFARSVCILAVAAYGLLADAAITQQAACAAIAGQMPDFAVELVESVDVKGFPALKISGHSAQQPVEIILDANNARLYRLAKGPRTVYEWPGIYVVGHRGTVTFAPENTLAAYRKAIELGAHAIEMDIRQTKDKHYVIMHDATLDRTTGASGLVAQKTLQELEALDAGKWFGERFAGERIPTLEQVLDALSGKAAPDLDFKAGEVEPFIDLLRARNLVATATFYSGNPKVLQEVRTLAPELRIRPTVRPTESGRQAIEELDPPILNIEGRDFSEALVLEAHLKFRLAFVNMMGGNDTAEGMQRAVDAGADFIQTDHLDILVGLLKDRGLYAKNLPGRPTAFEGLKPLR
ncbi:MAG: glycerophosphodiester phosphodiesterase family protein [Candidatus Hydrogenedentes bacterium]|nr:glycerophosphodiester phosphodiesterase family protein [Candidatus Hydrogenedentota bacterium]MBI3118733.1 glycerophosphodiester phosphodiesterase family protein [Candidatus Hydrogenedentota bacterium]